MVQAIFQARLLGRKIYADAIHFLAACDCTQPSARVYAALSWVPVLYDGINSH